MADIIILLQLTDEAEIRREFCAANLEWLLNLVVADFM